VGVLLHRVAVRVRVFRVHVLNSMLMTLVLMLVVVMMFTSVIFTMTFPVVFHFLFALSLRLSGSLALWLFCLALWLSGSLLWLVDVRCW
jgi:hypothetical protein